MSNRFSLETGYLILLFLILQNDDDKEGRIRRAHQRRVWMHDTLHWETEWCRRILHTCAWTMGPTAMTTDFSNMSEFHKRSLHIFYRSLNVTISRQTHDKVQITYILLTYVYRAYETTGLTPTYACASAAYLYHKSKQKRRLVRRAVSRHVAKSCPKRLGAVPLGCHAEINKSALIGQQRYRAGSRLEHRLL